MRVHLLAVPNTETTDAYPLDGFCVRTRYFARLLMRLGHEVYLYGAGENSTPCTVHLQCLSNDERLAMIGDTPYQAVPFTGTSPLFMMFNKRAAIQIRSTKRHDDVIATIAGGAQQLVSEQNPELLFLEYSIGYDGICAPFRVFQSQAWRHLTHGLTKADGGRLFDTVIPPWFDVPKVQEPEDYVVFCGRVVPVKGIKTACEAAQRAGIKLAVMGPGDPALVTYGEYLGEVSTSERDRILGKARAVLMPTQYIEPFGNVAAEAQLCGTPMITTDFGAFTESVVQGRTGFRCVTLGEFVQAIDLSQWLDRPAIRQRALKLYSEDAAMASYAAYFQRLALVRGEGMDSLNPTLPFVMAPASTASAAA